MAATTAAADEKLCYICYDVNSAVNPFLDPSPCACRGSLHLHNTCYNRLLELAAAEGKPAACTICKTKFTASANAYIDIDETDEDGIHRKGTRNILTGAYDGLLCAYHTNGEHWFVAEYKEGIRDGPYREWYEDGAEHTNGNSKNGELDGPYTEFWRGGKIRIQTAYKDGEYDGSYKEFSEDGILTVHYEYLYGMRNGSFNTYYAETGLPKRRSEYWYGEISGDEFNYYPSGNIEDHHVYVDGELDGTATTFYDAPGARESVVTWLHGKNMHATYYKEDGTVDRITRNGKRLTGAAFEACI
jgi:antitoxin component YwqK of YwqJK toxin-antitoxin module